MCVHVQCIIASCHTGKDIPSHPHTPDHPLATITLFSLHTYPSIPPHIHRCVKSAKPSQISLYLEEPTTCTYSLTVEGAFVCTLLAHTDEYGIFDLDSYEAAKDETKVEEEAGNTEETNDVVEAAKKSTDDVTEDKRTDASDEAKGEVAKDKTKPRDKQKADTAADNNQGNL